MLTSTSTTRLMGYVSHPLPVNYFPINPPVISPSPTPKPKSSEPTFPPCNRPGYRLTSDSKWMTPPSPGPGLKTPSTSSTCAICLVPSPTGPRFSRKLTDAVDPADGSNHRNWTRRLEVTMARQNLIPSSRGGRKCSARQDRRRAARLPSWRMGCSILVWKRRGLLTLLWLTRRCVFHPVVGVW